MTDEILGRIRAILDERDALREETERLKALIHRLKAENERLDENLDYADRVYRGSKAKTGAEIERLKDEIQKQDRIIEAKTEQHQKLTAEKVLKMIVKVLGIGNPPIVGGH